jgi:hypothetical protein
MSRWDIDINDGTSSRWPMGCGMKVDPLELPFLYPDTYGEMPAYVAPIPPPELGSLSARHESNGNPGAIGNDTTGGWSYGAYQIATKTPNQSATFLSFITFLVQMHPELAKPLQDAGGHTAAHKGTKKFRHAWVSLAKKHPVTFVNAQHEFIKMTHYDVQAFALKEGYALDVNQRSSALQNVVWSMAVQHGDGTQVIFEKVKEARPKGTKLSDLGDADLIHLLYAERSKVDTYFKHSTKEVKAGVKKRFEQEEREALEMLKKEGIVQVTPTGGAVP